MLSLDKRLTHTYVGTYQHEDKWEQIGSIDEIGSRALPRSEEEEEDPCDPQARKVFCLVKSDRPDDEIRQALHDTYTQHGCHCEHDCCGCRSYYAGHKRIKRVTGDLWEVVVSSSRNY
jgi:hypothetical protein